MHCNRYAAAAVCRHSTAYGGVSLHCRVVCVWARVGLGLGGARGSAIVCPRRDREGGRRDTEREADFHFRYFFSPISPSASSTTTTYYHHHCAAAFRATRRRPSVCTRLQRLVPCMSVWLLTRPVSASACVDPRRCHYCCAPGPPRLRLGCCFALGLSERRRASGLLGLPQGALPSTASGPRDCRRRCQADNAAALVAAAAR